MQHTPPSLETISVTVPEHALEIFEAALGSVCATVGFFRDDRSGEWLIEGVRQTGENEEKLVPALALAATLTGVAAPLTRSPTPAEGWLAHTRDSFPEQRIGRRFTVRGTHLTGVPTPGRITLVLDAGLAFGSGEHGSTRGCLRALERLAYRQPRQVLDLGTGSGILAIAAARLLHRRVLATDIEPWSVRVATRNAKANGVKPLVSVRLADGWRTRVVRASAPYDLVFANILARPLAGMAHQLSLQLAPGGAAILSGLIAKQARFVLAAHRRVGLVLDFVVQEGDWATLVVKRKALR